MAAVCAVLSVVMAVVACVAWRRTVLAERRIQDDTRLANWARTHRLVVEEEGGTWDFQLTDLFCAHTDRVICYGPFGPGMAFIVGGTGAPPYGDVVAHERG